MRDKKKKQPPRVHGPMAQFMPGDKARDFKGTFKKLFVYLGHHKKIILLVWILVIASTVFTIIGPKILGSATDELVSGVLRKTMGFAGINFTRIRDILLRLAGLYFISILFNYAQGYLIAGVSMKVTYRLRNEISEKIHKLPLKYFDKNTHGDVISRITNDVDTVSQNLNQSIPSLLSSFASVIGMAVMMLTISPLLTLVALLLLPLSTVFIMFIVKRSQKLFRTQQQGLGKLNGHIEEMFSNHVIVRAFNGEKTSVDKFNVYNETLYQSGWKANFLSGLMWPVIIFIGNITYVAVCVLGGILVSRGNMTLGGIQAFIQYVRQFGQPVTQIASVINVFQQTVAAAERVFEFLAEEEETEDIKVEPPMDAREKGQVAFKHVSFGYAPEVPVIHNFNAEIAPGQKIAIVGATGAGKTTIVKLLMRFYDVNGGQITVDGADIRLYTRNALRARFGMVLQDTWLFNGTIAENIRYGKLDASESQIIKAAVIAQADHFIRTLPDGYQMVINEEADNISAGQKQLLTIARSVLADPEILILDEATSNVDTRTEVLIQKAMDNLMKGRTSFVIAHRLSTIRSADVILVMRQGDIVEQGNHNELLEKNGVYAELYNAQFEKG
jgi:ATP-binding cassette subfamily B protein